MKTIALLTVLTMFATMLTLAIKASDTAKARAMRVLQYVALTLLVCMLAACGGGGGGGGDNGGSVSLPHPAIEPPCEPATIQYDYYGASGIIIEATNDSCLTAQEIEALYVETLACVGVATPTTAARVAFISYAGTGRNPTLLGSYQELSQDVWINEDKIKTVPMSRYVLSHEFIHHALYLQGLSHTDNHEHNSPAFDACTKFVEL